MMGVETMRLNFIPCYFFTLLRYKESTISVALFYILNGVLNLFAVTLDICYFLLNYKVLYVIDG